MHLAFTEEQEDLRASARAFLAEHSPPAEVRRAMQGELGHDPALWKRLGAELGWPGIAIPEAYGGAGLSQVELAALMEVMGEALLCAPFFSSVCLAANALVEAAGEEQKRRWLPGIAAGETLATLAFAEPGGAWGPEGVATTARAEGGDFVLSGRKRYVPDGHAADLVLVAAREPGTEGERGLSLYAVGADAPGLSRRALPTMDQTRRLAELRLEDVRVPASARLGEGETGYEALERALDLAAVALAAEQVGLAQRCLDLAVAHARSREQFGRPIGSFQAIKHKCADMMLLVESSRSAAYYAACVAAEGSADLARAASLARAWCSEAAFRCAAECLQIHGGVGFTWEYDVHLYLKRARASEILLGDPAWHRERVARLIGL